MHVLLLCDVGCSDGSDKLYVEIDGLFSHAVTIPQRLEEVNIMVVRFKLAELEINARRDGYADYASMLHELYDVERLSLPALAKRCHVSYARAKKHLKRFNIAIHSRGGRHESRVKVVLTPELLQEITENGVGSTAKRLGIDPNLLHVRLRALKPS